MSPGINVGDVVRFSKHKSMAITVNEVKKALMLTKYYHWDNLMMGLLEDGSYRYG